MKRSRFSEEQIIPVLREAESGTVVKDLCRRAGNQHSDVLQVEGEIRGHGNQRNASVASAGRGERAVEKACGAESAGHRCAEGGGVKKVVGPQVERAASVRIQTEVQEPGALTYNRIKTGDRSLPLEKIKNCYESQYHYGQFDYSGEPMPTFDYGPHSDKHSRECGYRD